jgi:hypothetical protein
MRGLIRRSDEVLFQAKRSGKNTVLTTQDVPQVPETSPTPAPVEPRAADPAVSGVPSRSSSE